MNKCKQCNNEFKPVRSTARYCTPKCRKLAFLAFSKDEGISVPSLSVPVDNGQVSATDNVEEVVEKLSTQESTFTPNWKRLGLKSKEEGMKHVMDYLKKQHARISAMGFT